MVTSPMHILVIEDDPVLAASLRASLEREGYLTTLKGTGQDGIDFARHHNPHLVLLDVRLPDLSGFDVCRQMRQHNLRQPIIMLTARREEMDKVLGLEMGADDYVTKPFSLRELLSRIRAQLRRAYGDLSGTNADQLYVRDLVGSVTRPVRELKGIGKIALMPGEARRVSFRLSTDDLRFHDRRLQNVVEPGEFKVWIAPSSSGGLEGEFRVVE